ncbi:hypothetical protein QR680_016132 [Steinernema hermaphroditum]|uniref:Uncharacterized protein n=1 Tax=Steinernema hermaphroditum TaxID=289476 RepID=A0AA39LLT7_9BILA|nr:hypothetical protein QR680_016132 [Steinernema hermaphroditum]
METKPYILLFVLLTFAVKSADGALYLDKFTRLIALRKGKQRLDRPVSLNTFGKPPRLVMAPWKITRDENGKIVLVERVKPT